MKQFLFHTFLLAFLISGISGMAQQDISFSQFYEMPMLRNPSLAGIFNGNVRFSSLYRNQWQGVTVPYRTTALGVEVKLFKGLKTGDFITVGLQATNDIAGDSKLKRTQFFPVINYHKLLNEEYNTMIAIGFMGGLVNESFDPSKLQFNDQFVNGSYSASNPTSQTFSKTGFHYMDISTGISVSSFISHTTKVYFGAGLFHFTQPGLTFMQNNQINLNKKWGVNAGLSKSTASNDRIVIYADYFMQGGDRLAQGGFLYTYNLDYMDESAKMTVSGGTVFRWKDAMIPVVKLGINHLEIGLSYDINLSRLKTASNYRGGFELTLSFQDLWNEKNITTEAVNCPTKIW